MLKSPDGATMPARGRAPTPNAKANGTREMSYSRERALQLLRIGSGIPDATFRDGQAEAIRHIVEGKKRFLVVQKTG